MFLLILVKLIYYAVVLLNVSLCCNDIVKKNLSINKFGYASLNPAVNFSPTGSPIFTPPKLRTIYVYFFDIAVSVISLCNFSNSSMFKYIFMYTPPIYVEYV